MTVAPLELVTLAAQHARDLRQHIGATLTPTIAAAASKAIRLSALHAGELDLLQTLALPLAEECDRRPVCGVWTARQLGVHVPEALLHFHGPYTD